MSVADLLSRVRAEIDARREELRPFVVEYERLSLASAALERQGSPAAAVGRASGSSTPARRGRGADRRPRQARGAAQQAILAALEHGSHTVSELVVVTAMTGPNIRENLRRLLKAGTVTRAKREGKAAYALAALAAVPGPRNGVSSR